MNIASGQEHNNLNSKLSIYNPTMSNLLKNLCIALGLFYFSVAFPIGPFSQLLDEIGNFGKTIHNNTVRTHSMAVIINVWAPYNNIIRAPFHHPKIFVLWPSVSNWDSMPVILSYVVFFLYYF